MYERGQSAREDYAEEIAARAARPLEREIERLEQGYQMCTPSACPYVRDLEVDNARLRELLAALLDYANCEECPLVEECQVEEQFPEPPCRAAYLAAEQAVGRGDTHA